MMRQARRAVSSCRAALPIAAFFFICAWAAQAGEDTGPSLHAKDAWIRWLPGNVPAGGYVTLVNESDVSWTLTGASSDAYGSVSLHQSHEQGGMSSMSPVDAVAIPPHSTLDFAQHGYHLMLMAPARLLKPGDTVQILLKFDRGRQMDVAFQLRSPDMLMSK